jgi:hypothetical protein
LRNHVEHRRIEGDPELLKVVSCAGGADRGEYLAKILYTGLDGDAGDLKY